MFKDIKFLKTEIRRIEEIKSSLIVDLEENPNELASKMLEFFERQATDCKELYKRSIMLLITKNLLLLSILFSFLGMIWDFKFFSVFSNFLLFSASFMILATAETKGIRFAASLASCFMVFLTIVSIFE